MYELVLGANPGQFWPTLVDFAPHFLHFGPKLVKFGPMPVDSGSILVDSAQTLVGFGIFRANFGQFRRAEFSRNRPDLAQHRSNSTEHWSIPGRVGRIWLDLPHVWAHLARGRPKSTGFGPRSAERQPVVRRVAIVVRRMMHAMSPSMFSHVHDSHVWENSGVLEASGTCGRGGLGVPQRALSGRAIPTRPVFVKILTWRLHFAKI